MTQEERDELQDYLNERIFGTRRQMRSKHADKQLTQGQKDFLYLIVRDVRNFVAKKVQSINDLDIAIIKVACCLRQINFHGMQPNPKNSKNIVPRDKMPFLVKQVLWLICYKALQAGLKQNDVFKEFEEYNIYVSHNFFSSLEQTPDYFLRCEEYSQPENPCKYMGQKKDELAVAIKNLVYQAGSHSCFVDIFGGSGSASVAVCRKRRVEYVYNELNTRVHNYVEMIAGQNYKDISEMLEKIQEDLRTPELSPVSKLGFSFQDELDTYIDAKETEGGFSEGVIEAERNLQQFAKGTYNFDVTSVKDILHKLDKALQGKKGNFKNDDKIQNITEDAITKVSSILASTNIIEDFGAHVDELNCLCEENNIILYDYPYKVIMTPVPIGFPRKEITYGEYRKCICQYKALGYYAYFKNMKASSKTIQNYSIEYAVGEIFLKYMATHGKEGSTAILDYVKQHYSHNAKNNIGSFIKEDFERKVKEFHDALSGTKIKNIDFRGIIEKYSTKNTLFYSDSPYISTSDYGDKVGGVPAFSGNDMKDLIKGLMQGVKTSGHKNTKKASKPNKFIFSMRAVKNREEIGTPGTKKNSEIVNGNQEICQYVYKEFASYNISLYVLVIYEKGKDLCDLIQKSKVIEIMITNYEIVSFEAKGKGKKKYVCEAFTFDKYLKKIKEKMVGYQKNWEL